MLQLKSTQRAFPLRHQLSLAGIKRRASLAQRTEGSIGVRLMAVSEQKCARCVHHHPIDHGPVLAGFPKLLCKDALQGPYLPDVGISSRTCIQAMN